MQLIRRGIYLCINMKHKSVKVALEQTKRKGLSSRYAS